MFYMQLEPFGHGTPATRVLRGIVVVPVGFLAELVQTVDLVEDVNLGDVGVGAGVPGWGRAHGEGGVFVGVGDGGAGDSIELVGGCAEPGPGAVDEGGGVVAEDGGVGVDVAVEGGEVEVEGEGAEDGRCLVREWVVWRWGGGSRAYNMRRFS